MSTPIISYNSAKITELQTEISDIPVTPAYDLQTKKITLDPESDNHGTIDKYARGDHTHFLDLNDIDMDLKLPVKIVDEEGKIKKILVHKTLVFETDFHNPVHFKIPEVPSFEVNNASIELNIKLVGKNTGDYIFSLFKVILYYTGAAWKCNLDRTYGGSKIEINYNIVYYDDEDLKRHFFFKLTMNSFQGQITYVDLSTDNYIPDDFSTTDMISLTLAKTATTASNTIITTNPFNNAAKLKGSNAIYVLTNSSANNPGITHSHIYSDSTTANWTNAGLVITGVYAWKYNVA
jgi:hypothetical protein